MFFQRGFLASERVYVSISCRVARSFFLVSSLSFGRSNSTLFFYSLYRERGERADSPRTRESEIFELTGSASGEQKIAVERAESWPFCAVSYTYYTCAPQRNPDRLMERGAVDGDGRFASEVNAGVWKLMLGIGEVGLVL